MLVSIKRWPDGNEKKRNGNTKVQRYREKASLIQMLEGPTYHTIRQEHKSTDFSTGSAVR